MGRILLAIGLLFGFAPSLAAQHLRGSATLPGGGVARGVVVTATEVTGAASLRAITGEHGDFDFGVPPVGRYLLRLSRVGFHSTVFTVEVPTAGDTAIRIEVNGEPVSVGTLSPPAGSNCQVMPDSGTLVGALWQQARTVLVAIELTAAARGLAMSWTNYDRLTTRSGAPEGMSVVSVRNTGTERPFPSRSADDLARAGYVLEDSAGVTYAVPTVNALLSDAFASRQCLQFVAPPPGQQALFGIGYHPPKDGLGEVKEIEGTFWLDRTSTELRAGGRLEFTRLPTGSWIISRWELRTPRIRRGIDTGHRNTFSNEVGLTMVVGWIHEIGGAVTEVRESGRVVFRDNHDSRRP